MGEYTLANTAAVIDASIQKVAGADTTPKDISPLMVTSGGVKAYVDTQDTALETQINNLESEVANLSPVTISTCSLSKAANTTNDNIVFSGLTKRFGSDDTIHQLVISSTYVLKTPTAGVSVVSVNATINDPDDDANDNYILSLYADSGLIAQIRTADSFTTTIYQLCFSGYFFQNSTITMSVGRLSGASTGYSVTGGITCVNYQ